LIRPQHENASPVGAVLVPLLPASLGLLVGNLCGHYFLGLSRPRERIVDVRWLDLSRIALRLETCRRLTGDEVQELVAPLRRAA
jgi:hypothetical protein